MELEIYMQFMLKCSHVVVVVKQSAHTHTHRVRFQPQTPSLVTNYQLPSVHYSVVLWWPNLSCFQELPHVTAHLPLTSCLNLNCYLK